MGSMEFSSQGVRPPITTTRNSVAPEYNRDSINRSCTGRGDVRQGGVALNGVTGKKCFSDDEAPLLKKPSRTAIGQQSSNELHFSRRLHHASSIEKGCGSGKVVHSSVKPSCSPIAKPHQIDLHSSFKQTRFFRVSAPGNDFFSDDDVPLPQKPVTRSTMEKSQLKLHSPLNRGAGVPGKDCFSDDDVPLSKRPMTRSTVKKRRFELHSSLNRGASAPGKDCFSDDDVPLSKKVARPPPSRNEHFSNHPISGELQSRAANECRFTAHTPNSMSSNDIRHGTRHPTESLVNGDTHPDKRRCHRMVAHGEQPQRCPVKAVQNRVMPRSQHQADQHLADRCSMTRSQHQADRCSMTRSQHQADRGAMTRSKHQADRGPMTRSQYQADRRPMTRSQRQADQHHADRSPMTRSQQRVEPDRGPMTRSQRRAEPDMFGARSRERLRILQQISNQQRKLRSRTVGARQFRPVTTLDRRRKKKRGPAKDKLNNDTLLLIVTRQWFDLMETGEKKIEYRTPGAWIETRLFHQQQERKYKFVKFVNGYGSHCPYFFCRFNGVSKSDYVDVSFSEGSRVVGGPFYQIHLGDRVENAVAKQEIENTAPQCDG